MFFNEKSYVDLIIDSLYVTNYFLRAAFEIVSFCFTCESLIIMWHSVELIAFPLGLIWIPLILLCMQIDIFYQIWKIFVIYYLDSHSFFLFLFSFLNSHFMYIWYTWCYPTGLPNFIFYVLHLLISKTVFKLVDSFFWLLSLLLKIFCEFLSFVVILCSRIFISFLFIASLTFLIFCVL